MSSHPTGSLRRSGRRGLRAVSLGLLLFSLAALLNVTFTALAAETSTEEALENPEDYLDDPDAIRFGRDLFGAQCATCHGEAGRGVSREASPNAYGPPVNSVGPAAVDFMIRTGRMPLENPQERLRHQEQKLTERERRAVVAYVASLAPEDSGTEIPEIGGWEDADLSRGLELFTSNCAACHGPTAAGIAVGQQDVSSTLDVATPLEIAEAVRTGPGVMPVFSEDVLPQEDLEAVVAWVMDLRQREAPGGAQIGRSGPVTEGFVAWLVGIGALTVVMYLLGQKASGDGDDEPNA